MIMPMARNVKSLAVGARWLLGYYLGRPFTSVQPGKLVPASLLKPGASNAGYRCPTSVTDRCSQKESQAQFEAFSLHNVPPSICFSLPRLGLTDNRKPLIQQARASKRYLLHRPVEVRAQGQ